MKAIKVCKATMLSLVLVLAVSAFAANKGSLEVTDTVLINGKSLAAGDYALSWEGNGPDVQLSIMKGKKVVAQTAAKLITIDHSFNRNSAVLEKNSAGAKVLKEIHFDGKKYALAIGEGTATGSSGDAMSK